MRSWHLPYAFTQTLEIDCFSFFLSFCLFIHEKQRETETEGDRERQRERERESQREKQAPCRTKDVGFNPETPESCFQPKAGAKPLSHTG